MRKAHLYVIQSESRPDKYYVGVSTDYVARFGKHNRREVDATKTHAPYQLIHIEQFENLALARRREKFLKSGDGRRVLQMKLPALSLPAKQRGGLPKNAAKCND